MYVLDFYEELPNSAANQDTSGNQSMRISFVLNTLGKSGGVLVVLMYAKRLANLGHDVTIYCPVIPYAEHYTHLPHWKRPIFRVYTALRSLSGARRGVINHKGMNVRRVPLIQNLFLRDAEVVIATAWPTAYDVAALQPRKGRKAYLIQGYETWDGHLDKVRGTYRLPLALITVSPWLSELVSKDSGRRVALELPNGLDPLLFYPPKQKPENGITVLMMHHRQPAKGLGDGLAVINRVKGQHPEVRFKMFGMEDFSDKPDFIEYHKNPSAEALVSLYQESHIYLNPSLSEGWGMTTLEAMACGCAVVATNVGCAPLFGEQGGLLAAPPGDRDGLFLAVSALLESRTLLEETARKGVECSRQFTWEQSTSLLSSFLESLVRDSSLTAS
jgi:glycosyltransferase involved in cell wall biosynthesis